MRRRPLAVLALAVALAAASAQLARAGGGGTVTITPSGEGAPVKLSLAALAGSFDVRDAPYALRGADGSMRTVTVADGISLGALIAAAGLDGDPFTYVRVPWPNGTGSAYALRTGDAPVVWSDAQGVHFLRPSAGAGDANAEDAVTAADGRLSLQLRTGPLLVPRVSVSPPQGHLHEPIVFDAWLAGGVPLPAGMRFQWYFDGGAYRYGARVTHRFPESTTYKVQLHLLRGEESVHLPTIVHVRIADVPAKPTAAQGAVVPAGGAGASGSGTGGADAPFHTTASAAASRPRTVAPAPQRRLPKPRALPGQLVSGTLIASASAAAPLAGGAAAADATASTPSADRPLHVPIGAWVALGLAALLGLGWVLESRHTLPFWQP